MSKKAKASKPGVMSMDIRDMFKQQPSKNPPPPKTAKEKAAVVIDEDEDFKPAPARVKGKPQVQKEKVVSSPVSLGTSPGGARTKRARPVIKDDSDEEVDMKKKNKAHTTPPKDVVPWPKPVQQGRKHVQSLSDVFGGVPVKRSETPADQMKLRPSLGGSSQEVCPTGLSVEDVRSLEDFDSNSQDGERIKEIGTHMDKNFQKTLQELTDNGKQKRPQSSEQSTPSKRLRLEVKRVSTEGIATPPSSQKASVESTPTEATPTPSSFQNDRSVEPCTAEKVLPLKEKEPPTKKTVKRAIAYLDVEDGEEGASGKNAKKPEVDRNTTGDEAKPVPISTAAGAVPPTQNPPGAMISPQKSHLVQGYRIPKLSPGAAGHVVKQLPVTVCGSPSQTKSSEGTASSPSGGKSEPSSSSSSTPTEWVKPRAGTPHSSRGAKLSGKPAKQLFVSPTKPSKVDAKLPFKSPEQYKQAKPALDVPKVSRGASYHSYLSRGGPRAPGSKPIPLGKEDCLEGLTFVISGVLESLEREEASDLIKKYGGKVTQSLSKKTSYLVVGEDAGGSKLAKATALGTKQISEDELLELIRTREKEPVASAKSAAKTPKSKRPAEKSTTGSSLSPVDTTPSHPLSTPSREPSTPHVITTPMQTPLLSSQDVKTPTGIVQGTENLMWVDRYRPRMSKNIIGQQGDKSCAKKLAKWLQDWQRNRAMGKESSSSAGSDSGAEFKAALLSGPPGIGKTTTATVVCEECGYTYVELNASSTRSKKSLQADVASQIGSLSLDSFVTGGEGVGGGGGGGGGMTSGRKHALIMDEVDGMAGNEDRGGVQELISLIKSTKVPIICICNDRMHPKIRSLSNHCYDLRFHKPKIEQIKGAIMSVAYKEKIKIPPQALEQLIVASGHDIRQVLHNLSLWSVAEKSLSFEQAKGAASGAKKNISLGPFDVVRTVFMPREDGREMTFNEKSDLFFYDYNIAALFVQENYPMVNPMDARGDMKAVLQRLSRTADSLSDGNLIEKQIRGASMWNLLPIQAVFSSVIPGSHMRGPLGKPHFPLWLGNNSKKTKFDRLLQELHRHASLSTSCNKTELCLDYIPLFHSRLTGPLLKSGEDGIPEVIACLNAYNFTRDDWESIIELSHYNGSPDVLKRIPAKVKSAFTRTYNKGGHLNPYAMAQAPVKKRGRGGSAVEGSVEEGAGENWEEEEGWSLPLVSEEDEEGVAEDPVVRVKANSKTKQVGGGNAVKRAAKKKTKL